jgi:hypothetical protein
MKKICLMITVIWFIAITANAQDQDYRESVNFGIKAGLNYSNVYDSEGEDFDANPKLGFSGGMFLSIPIGKFIGFQPELLYSQKGFQATGRLFGSPYNFTRTTTFIDVPVLFAIKPTEFFTFLAGPQYAFLVKQKDVFGSGSSSVEQETEFENDNVRRNILCFIGGFDINISHIVIGARAGWDIQKNNGDGTSTTPRYKNVWYQGTIGYRF